MDNIGTFFRDHWTPCELSFHISYLLLLLLDETEVELEIRQKQSYSSCLKGQLSVLS